MKAWDREGAEKMLLLGDVLYHGPRNDLPREYAPKEVIEMLNARKEAILCVRGNCDTEVDQMVLGFPILADYALLCLEGTTVYATHGHVYHTGNLPPLQPGDILLHGHTHVPAWEDHGGWMYLNPGSVSIPKGESRRGYMTLENDTFLWKDLEGNVKMEWS
jgi:putative phosphoesterase